MIATAEELIIKQYGDIYDRRPESEKSKLSKERYIELFGLGKVDGIEPGTKELMIEFARLHVEEALHQAFLNSKIRVEDPFTNDEPEIRDIYEDGCISITIQKKSILNAYPLDLIK